VQSVQSVRMLTWHDRTLMWLDIHADVEGDVAVSRGLAVVVESVVDTWQFLANGMVPRGPVMGCHVAPLYWLLV
jgi:hypothetical protein